MFQPDSTNTAIFSAEALAAEASAAEAEVQAALAEGKKAQAQAKTELGSELGSDPEAGGEAQNEAEAETEAETELGSDPEEEQPATHQHKRSPTERRIAKLASKLAQKDAEIAALREMTARSQGQGYGQEDQGYDRAPSQVQQPVAVKPSLDDFPDIASFQEALVDWKLAQREAVSQQQAKAQAIQSEYNQRVAAFQKNEAPDFVQAVEEILPLVTQSVSAFVLESKVGPALLYHLANQEDEQERFANMSDVRKVAYLANLETSLSQPKQRKAVPAPAKKVAAVPVGGQGTGQAGSYEEWRRARLAAKSRS